MPQQMSQQTELILEWAPKEYLAFVLEQDTKAVKMRMLEGITYFHLISFWKQNYQS
jgi:hypothetical protein